MGLKRRRLSQVGFVFVRIVEEGETQPEILAAELARQGWKRIRRGDSAVSRAVERHISRAVDVSQSGDLAIFRDRKFDGYFSLLEQWSHSRFRNDVVPILLH